MYTEFGGKVTRWCTLNEPAVYTLGGYVSADFPPGQRDAFDTVCHVVANLCRAHVALYRTIKAVQARCGYPTASVGLVKSVFPLHPARWWHPLDRFFTRAYDALYHDVWFDFMTTGRFRIYLPGRPFPALAFDDPMAPACHDFIGLNYYSHYHIHASIGWQGLVVGLRHLSLPHTVMSDMPYPLFAEGLYHALARLHTLFPETPIYITECGVADKHDCIRHLHLRRYLYAVSKARRDFGVPVKGFFYWTLMDKYV